MKIAGVQAYRQLLQINLSNSVDDLRRRKLNYLKRISADVRNALGLNYKPESFFYSNGRPLIFFEQLLNLGDGEIVYL